MKCTKTVGGGAGEEVTEKVVKRFDPKTIQSLNILLMRGARVDWGGKEINWDEGDGGWSLGWGWGSRAGFGLGCGRGFGTDLDLIRDELGVR